MTLRLPAPWLSHARSAVVAPGVADGHVQLVELGAGHAGPVRWLEVMVCQVVQVLINLCMLVQSFTPRGAGVAPFWR